MTDAPPAVARPSPGPARAGPAYRAGRVACRSVVHQTLTMDRMAMLLAGSGGLDAFAMHGFPAIAGPA
jgi:hypothetical protein